MDRSEEISCCGQSVGTLWRRMDIKKLLRYTMQLAMLKQLLTKKLIDENEYSLIQKRLMKDYGIVSNITA